MERNIWAERLLKLRGDKSREDVAKEVGKILGREVKRETVFQWENDKRQIKADAIRALAIYYGVSADYILGLTGAETNDKDVQAVCEYTGLSAKTVNALHRMNDSTGFVRCFLEALIAPGFEYENGPDALPLEEARKYVFQAAMAFKNAKAEMREFVTSGAASASPSDEVYYYNRFRYDAESGRYYMDGLDASGFLLGEASAVLQEAQRDIFEQIMHQIALEGISEIKSLLPDWEEENAE